VSVRSGRALGTVVTPALLLVAGCATGVGDTAGPARVAAAFYGALSAGDGQVACRLLATTTRAALVSSESKPCPAAISSAGAQSSAVVSVTVFGQSALVRLNADTAFLSRFSGRWRVVAAGCKQQPGRPYDCRLESG